VCAERLILRSVAALEIDRINLSCLPPSPTYADLLFKTHTKVTEVLYVRGVVSSSYDLPPTRGSERGGVHLTYSRTEEIRSIEVNC
jgi:hypothetical protein